MRLGRRHFEPHELDLDGCPWIDEPVPERDPAIAERFARKVLAYDGPDGNGRLVWPYRGQQLVRHIGRRRGGGDEWLPVTLVDGQYPPRTQHPELDRVRSILGGEGTVRSTSGRYDVFRLVEAPARSPLDGRPCWRGVDTITRGNGPVEITYVWNGPR